MDKTLPDFLLADLFPSSLVLIETNIEPKKDPINEPETVNKTIVNSSNNGTIKVFKDQPKDLSENKVLTEKWYLGNNGKNITVIVSESEAVYLTEKSLQFLTKILGACKLNMGDIAVVNIEQTPTNFEFIKTALLPRTCILFNVKAQSILLPFTVPDYQIQKYGGCTFLMAPAIASIDNESADAKLAKTKLWVSLKSIFNL